MNAPRAALVWSSGCSGRWPACTRVSSWACSCASTFHENSEYSLACEYSRVGSASYLQPDNALTALHGVDPARRLDCCAGSLTHARSAPARPVRAVVQMPCWMPAWTQAVVHWLHVRLGDRLVRHVPARPRRRRLFAAGVCPPLRLPAGRASRARTGPLPLCAVVRIRPMPQGSRIESHRCDSARTRPVGGQIRLARRLSADGNRRRFFGVLGVRACGTRPCMPPCPTVPRFVLEPLTHRGLAVMLRPPLLPLGARCRCLGAV